MKKCNICNKEKELTDFYKGHARCKLCYIEKVKKHRDDNYDYYSEYDKKRSNLPHRVEARLKYSQTEQGKEKSRKAKDKWSETNVIKKAASTMIGNAIRDGKIIKPNECSDCGKTGKIHGHHDDYALPMVVRWLCSRCHRLWHKINGEALNG